MNTELKLFLHPFCLYDLKKKKSERVKITNLHSAKLALDKAPNCAVKRMAVFYYTVARSVAQLARASVSKTEGWGFETLHSCHSEQQ